MIKIRKSNCFDKFRLKKILSFLSDDAVKHYTMVLKAFPYMTLHDLLPLQLKFLPETYIVEDNKKQILGMASVSKTHGNSFKININRLYLDSDYFNIGKQLLDFIVAKYGAKGASSFLAIIDDSNEELLQLFVDGCSFRQCSSEQLWKLDYLKFDKPSETFIRNFKNSDASIVAEMFNDSVIQHFKYTISRTKREYFDNIFKGVGAEISFKYIAQAKDKSINSYFSIITTDNHNYVVTITTSPWAESCPYDDILKFAQREIRKRNKNFEMYIRLRKYSTTASALEEYLNSKNAKCVQNQVVLVKDFYQVAKEPQSAQKVVLFNEISEKTAFKAKYEE